MGTSGRSVRRSGGVRSGAGLIGAIVVAAALLAGGGAALTSRISASLLRQDAEAAALAWAADLSTNLSDLPALIERRPPSPESLTRLAMARGVGGVFRYKVYDRRGNLVFVSDDIGRADPKDLERDLASHRHNSPIAVRILAGGTHVEAARGTPPHLPAYYAEAYVPVRRDGAILGVVEVYVDQTAQRARYNTAFLLTEALTTGLILAAGLLPLGVAYRQIRCRRDAEARQALLAREVDHRAKNVLAVVQSVLRLTPKGDAVAYARAVEGRVAALARAHALLAEEAWAGAELRVLAERELAPYIGGSGDDGCGAVALLEGPSFPLAATAVQPLAVVLHELATNAAKHGALSAPGGLVRLFWSVEPGAGLLRLRWTESGGPSVSGPPRRRGFGSKVIDATTRGQLGGKAAFEWNASGLCADIAFPLERVLAPPSSVRPWTASLPKNKAPPPDRPAAAAPAPAAAVPSAVHPAAPLASLASGPPGQTTRQVAVASEPAA